MILLPNSLGKRLSFSFIFLFLLKKAFESSASITWKCTKIELSFSMLHLIPFRENSKSNSFDYLTNKLAWWFYIVKLSEKKGREGKQIWIQIGKAEPFLLFSFDDRMYLFTSRRVLVVEMDSRCWLCLEKKGEAGWWRILGEQYLMLNTLDQGFHHLMGSTWMWTKLWRWPEWTFSTVTGGLVKTC